MRTWAEISYGIVRYIFEAPEAPRGLPGIYFHDITDYDPRPQLMDEFDPGTGSFRPALSNDPLDPKNLEIAWHGVRNTRNTALNLSDYTQMLDFPDPVMRRRYAKYRQELRDLPEKYTSPYAVVFPLEPYKSEIKLTIWERLYYVWSYFKNKRHLRSR